MPETSLAVFENRIREHCPSLPRADVRRTAKIAKRRFDEFTHEPTEEEMLLLFSTITYADPTPAEAFRNIEREGAQS